MTEGADQIAARPVLLAAEPQLFVADIATACAFFTKLGFAVAFLYGEPPFYGQVRRDGAALNLRCVNRPVIERERSAREQLLSAAITVATNRDIKQLYAEFEAAGVTFERRLQREPWGAENFMLRDPDANLLLFAGPGE